MPHSFLGVMNLPGNASVIQALLTAHDDVEPAAQVIRLHVHDLERHSIVARLPLLPPCQAGVGQGILRPALQQRLATKAHTLETTMWVQQAT